ncbi:VWA domain-containing protein [Candidatus Woesearchaeota archaeon]|nr:VWA domain-containing protein [Candidatus Woesearchaeota archaeon]
MLPFGINVINNLGWYAFTSLALLILLYLMRPKPQEKNIPSLMFFIQQKGLSRKSTFFLFFLGSLLFLLQFAALGVLSFSTTQPFTTMYGEQSIESTVIVLDASASMGANGRFNKAIDIAKGKINGKTSIILAQNYPVQVLQNGDREEATKILSTLEPRHTSTNLGDSMLLAADLIGNRIGKVYVISDFIATEGPDPLVAKRILLSKGIPVEFISVTSEGRNAAIVDVIVGKLKSTAVIKNYDEEERTATLSIVNSQGTNHIMKKILANSIETIEFNTPSGQTELRLEEKDDLETDNHAYITAENIKKIKVLLVTNSEKSYLKTALQSSKDIQLEIAEPPIIPEINHDIIIIHSASYQLILPDFYQDSLKKARNGSSIIITYQQDVESNPLLPVRLEGRINNSKISTVIINKFTSDVDFGTSFMLPNASVKKGATVIAEGDGSAALTMKDEGNGKIIYYGIIDEYSDFKTTVSYPIFWNKLINFLTGTEDLKEYNFNTGKIYSDSSGKQYLEKAGFYTVSGNRVSASLINSLESDISKDDVNVLEEEKALYIKESKEKRDVKLEQYLIIAGAAILLLELLYIKWRGDI